MRRMRGESEDCEERSRETKVVVVALQPSMTNR